MKGPRIVEYLYLCITDSACSFKQSEIDEENVLSLSYEIISDLNDLLNILPKKRQKILTLRRLEEKFTNFPLLDHLSSVVETESIN